MSHSKARRDGIDSNIPADKGDMTFFREALDTDQLGFTVLTLESREAGMEHDHADQGIEEVYYVVDGAATVTVDGDAVSLEEGGAVRVAPGATRQITAGDDGVTMVLASAPVK